MLGNCVDVPHTTHRAAGFGKLAEPGPFQQNPRNEHRNHIRLSPGGLQKGLSQELIPEETISSQFKLNLKPTMSYCNVG